MQDITHTPAYQQALNPIWYRAGRLTLFLPWGGGAGEGDIRSICYPLLYSLFHFKGSNDLRLYEKGIGEKEKIRRRFEKHFKSPFTARFDLPSLFLLRSRLFLLTHLQF